MSVYEFIGIVLSSSVLSSVINGIYSLFVSKREYIQEYYKIIIQKRVLAYENLEDFILQFKLTLMDDDNKFYHYLFNEGWTKLYTQLLATRSIWLSDIATSRLTELTRFILMPTSNEVSSIEFAKSNYEHLANIRHELEKIIADDMLNLHDVKSFLKNKKMVASEFIKIEIQSSATEWDKPPPPPAK